MIGLGKDTMFGLVSIYHYLRGIISQRGFSFMENFNMDFSKKVIIETSKQSWVDSPIKGVQRIRLEREHEESGRTTSIVEYKPGSYFDSHRHPMGEEIYVLEGVFSDESGDYGPGTYIRNPPKSTHQPFSVEGCKIFVKLNAMSLDDKEQLAIDITNQDWLQGHGGLNVMPLYSSSTESTTMVKWPQGEKFNSHNHWGGEEILVIKGEFIDEYGRYPVGTWIRSPHMSQHTPYVEEETIILVKTGHLPK